MIAQLVERRTVVGQSPDILRSAVRLRLAGKQFFVNPLDVKPSQTFLFQPRNVATAKIEPRKDCSRCVPCGVKFREISLLRSPS